ncbi:hypothetical protein [Hymenobacter perfusus]|uniref:Uncharacterized protein n=1 Tax=Hymenobacter perfusus TaxID=1236770 RepID=A0A3R9MHG2_9BACT|nr:hypothetical protein [Hymenobacter perfusus]RSK42277.1 hypothetical protein EI293_15250 [Hymenobacter perfusus]
MSNLEIPKAIRLATKSEVPRAYWKKVDAGQAAAFVEGFVLTGVEDPEQLFRFYAEVNVNNSRLWEVLVDLAAMLPDRCACIFCWYEDADDVIHGEYQDKTLVLEELASLNKELVQDCYLEFGLIYNDEKTLVEVYVAESKFIKVWGVNKEHFESIMKKHNLPAHEEMHFVDEFPKVVVPFTSLDTEARPTEEILDLLKEVFLK